MAHRIHTLALSCWAGACLGLACDVEETPAPPAPVEIPDPQGWDDGEDDPAEEPDAPDDTDPPPPDDRPDIDPAPGIEEPGLHDEGTGCPTVTPADEHIDAGAVTAYQLSGSASGASAAQFYVRGRNQEEIVGTIPLGAGGDYAVTVPVFCGDNIVKRVFTNASCAVTLVTELVTTECVDADLRVTTVWDAGGADWELHLVKPGGSINDNATDCTWTSCVSVRPDWGVAGDATDDPKKDVDWLGSYGPENIVLDGLEPGVYTVLVEHWSSAGSADSDGRVIINLAGKLIVIDIEDLAPHQVWTAARITWPEATVEALADVHDCSSNWSGGCRDALP